MRFLRREWPGPHADYAATRRESPFGSSSFHGTSSLHGAQHDGREVAQAIALGLPDEFGEPAWIAVGNCSLLVCYEQSDSPAGRQT